MRDTADTTAHQVSIATPLENAEVTFLEDVTGTATHPDGNPPFQEGHHHL